MGCLGVYFSLSEDEVQDLQRIPECERPDYIHEELEEVYFAHHPERMAESDKAWDAMHRALADGQLSRDGGAYPLNHVVIGGESLYSESDFIMMLKTPAQVRDRNVHDRSPAGYRKITGGRRYNHRRHDRSGQPLRIPQCGPLSDQRWRAG